MEGSSLMMTRSVQCGPSISVVTVALFSVLLFASFFATESKQLGGTDEVGLKKPIFSERDSTGFIERNLLQTQSADISKIDTDYGGDANRIGENTCSKADIRIFQAPTATLPNGIPSFTVEILNACPSSGCSISKVHVKCGWFSSVRLINPRVFRRLSFDDCLVKNGDPLAPGETLSFQYANTFQYPLSVSSIAGCLT